MPHKDGGRSLHYYKLCLSKLAAIIEAKEKNLKMYTSLLTYYCYLSHLTLKKKISTRTKLKWKMGHLKKKAKKKKSFIA